MAVRDSAHLYGPLSEPQFPFYKRYAYKNKRGNSLGGLRHPSI